MSETEKIKVKRIKIEGKDYLFDKRTNIVYDNETYEPIGIFKDDKLELYDDEEEDEEEEDEEEEDDEEEDEEDYGRMVDDTDAEDAYARRAKKVARMKMKKEEKEKDFDIKFRISLADFPAWNKLGFTEVPEAYWDGDLWDYGDLFDYEDKKRFVFVSTKIPLNEDLNYQLLVKRDGKKIEPLGVIIDDKADKDMMFLRPTADYFMFLQYFGSGSDEIENLGASGFIAGDEEEEEEVVAKKEEEKVDVNLEKRKEMEEVIRKLGELYTRLKAEYQENSTPDKLKEAQKAKKILQIKKQEYLDFINTLDEDATRTKPTKVRFGTGNIDNPALYEKAKKIADEKYKKPSAYKSGFIIKTYKELGGTYSGEKPKKTGIARWFKEEWKDIGNKEYPVYRPTKRITLETPLTPEEIKPSNLLKQIKLKQEIKGDANLPPFEAKTGGKVVAIGVQAEKIPKQDEVWKWSNPIKVAEMAKKYLGDMAVVFRSTKPKKKYMIFDPVNKKWVHFGEINYEDFTKHQDLKRRENYLTRTASMKGNWKNNRYSANNLSRNILW